MEKALFFSLHVPSCEVCEDFAKYLFFWKYEDWGQDRRPQTQIQFIQTKSLYTALTIAVFPVET